jgi:5-oxoprolinase (ATP-hydrolysing)
LDAEASRARLRELSREVRIKEREVSEQQLLQGFLDLACEIMADAIRRISVAEGYDPTDYTLLAFGGAGPQHACDVATRLGIQQVFAPHHAGILSAVGLHHSLRERFAGREVLRPFAEIAQDLPEMVSALVEEATRFLQADGVVPNEIAPPACLAEVRLQGQDAPVQVPFQTSGEILAGYGAAHERLFGYRPPKGRIPELVSLRISVRERADQRPTDAPKPESVERQAADQPQLLQDAFSTLVVPPEWKASRLKGIGYLVKHERNSNDSKTTVSPLLDRDLFRHRFHSVVDEMGALLCRTAISTNIRERLDFSCALLDANGHLISSAPHIPVHLGALGACVRHTLEVLDLKPGDTAITNHPAYGGSHLPDVTLITPVHLDDGTRLGFVASRAHHAEIGGKTPGSMPADATKLAEEGVVIAPRLLVERGVDRFAAIRELLEAGPWPSRNPADNIADLHAQLAANRLGADRLTKLAADDPSGLHGAMRDILSHSASVLRSHLDHLPQVCSARESLDDGHEIAVCVRRDADRLVIDFSGTSSTHPGNLNATTAIVRSAVLFFLRVLLREDLPLNEGLVESVDILTPTGMLNPEFTGDPAEDPAVVGGNVEVSQRIVDTLFKAFELQAGSQGTMNNLLFGDASFGYYETIGGGAGAGPEQPGASGLHTHMTNTAITDPEILERRFPIRLRRFEVRRGSGGVGQLPGGDGLVREYEFLKPLTVSLLTQRRRAGPFGLHGGNPGSPGIQTIHRTDGSSVKLPSSATIEADIGDRLVMQTPGGGGWGVPD